MPPNPLLPSNARPYKETHPMNPPPQAIRPQPFRIADSRKLHAAKTDPTLPSNAPTPTRTKNVHPVNPPRAVRHPNHFIAPLSPHTAIPYPSSQSIPWRSQTPSPLIPKINDPGPPLSPHTAIPSSQSIPSSHLRPSPSSPAMDPIQHYALITPRAKAKPHLGW